MVHDDDEGPPPHIDIRTSQYPAGRGRTWSLPAHVERTIIELGRRSGYVPERIRDYCLEELGYDVPVRVIRQVLAMNR